MQKPFRFGVVSAGLTSPDTWVPLARRVEELGYASLLMPDRPSIGGFALFSAQAVEHLLEQRERYSLSYIQVFDGHDGQAENFAPVVARLNGI